MNKVTIYPQNKTIEVAPGQRVVDLAREDIPRVGVCDWMPAGDGTYRPVARIHELLIRVTEAERIVRIPYLTLRRLVRGEFVKGVQITPGNVLIDLHSYYEHVENCKDPEFWTEKKRRRYSEAL